MNCSFNDGERMSFKMMFYTFVLALGLIASGKAQSVNGFVLHADVQPGTAPGTLSIKYTAQNPSSNTSPVWIIEIDITKPANSKDLSSSGLTVGPSFLSDISSAISEDPTSRPMVPTVAEAPSEWVSSLSTQGKLTVFATESLLAPGQSINFQLNTSGFPGLRTFCVRPYISIHDIQVTPPNGDAADLKRYASEVAAVEDQAAFCGTTVGPTSPPAKFDAVSFLGTLQEYASRSWSEKWINNIGLLNSIVAKLNAAQAALSRGDNNAAKSQLSAVLNEVDAQAGKQLTFEAVGLLKFNTQYALSQIP